MGRGNGLEKSFEEFIPLITNQKILDDIKKIDKLNNLKLSDITTPSIVKSNDRTINYIVTFTLGDEELTLDDLDENDKNELKTILKNLYVNELSANGYTIDASLIEINLTNGSINCEVCFKNEEPTTEEPTTEEPTTEEPTTEEPTTEEPEPEPEPQLESIWDKMGDDIDGEAAGDWSGFSVALSGNGDIVAIGAIKNSDNSEQSGHVRVYHFANNEWVQLGDDIDGEAADDNSGSSVALSDDGRTVAIGAPYNSGKDNKISSGHVRVYTWNETVENWEQLGDDIDGEESIDFSGDSVALSDDGRIVAIGAYGNDNNGQDSGHVRVYTWNNSTEMWDKRGDDIIGEKAGDQSGWSVALSSDGATVAIGAINNDGKDDEKIKSGHVRVYRWNENNGNWDQVGDNINGEAAGDKSGWSVALSSDGNIVAIGAPYNNNNGQNIGHVRVYHFVNNEWTQVGQDINGEASYDESGYSVALNNDGNIVTIGAPYNGENSGRVKVYTLNENNEQWEQLAHDIDGQKAGDRNGYSVAMNNDGNIVAIGAPYNSSDNNNNSGYVRVYKNIDRITLSNYYTYINDNAILSKNGDLYTFNGDHVIDENILFEENDELIINATVTLNGKFIIDSIEEKTCIRNNNTFTLSESASIHINHINWNDTMFLSSVAINNFGTFNHKGSIVIESITGSAITDSAAIGILLDINSNNQVVSDYIMSEYSTLTFNNISNNSIGIEYYSSVPNFTVGDNSRITLNQVQQTIGSGIKNKNGNFINNGIVDMGTVNSPLTNPYSNNGSNIDPMVSTYYNSGNGVYEGYQGSQFIKEASFSSNGDRISLKIQSREENPYLDDLYGFRLIKIYTINNDNEENFLNSKDLNPISYVNNRIFLMMNDDLVDWNYNTVTDKTTADSLKFVITYQKLDESKIVNVYYYNAEENTFSYDKL